MGMATAIIIAFSGTAFAQGCNPKNPHIWFTLTEEQLVAKGLGAKAASLSEVFIAASSSISYWDVTLSITDCPFDGYDVRSRKVFRGVPVAHVKPRYALYISEETLRRGSEIDLARIVRKQICLMKTGIVTEEPRGQDMETPALTRCMIDFAVIHGDEQYEGWLRTKLALAAPEISNNSAPTSDLDQKIKMLEGPTNIPPQVLDTLKRLRNSFPQ